jgi:2-methylisocitrate lyase-like PEP mutase family enzyme
MTSFVVGDTVEDLQRAGVSLATYAGHSLVAHYLAARAWLQRLRQEGTSLGRDQLLQAVDDINQAVGGPANSELAQRYGVT